MVFNTLSIPGISLYTRALNFLVASFCHFIIFFPFLVQMKEFTVKKKTIKNILKTEYFITTSVYPAPFGPSVNAFFIFHIFRIENF